MDFYTNIIIGVAIFVVGYLISEISKHFENKRVEYYFRKYGLKLIDKRWTSSDIGWFHEVIYEDENGNLHKAYVETAMFNRVYLKDDHIIQEDEIPDDGICTQCGALASRKTGLCPECRLSDIKLKQHHANEQNHSVL